MTLQRIIMTFKPEGVEVRTLYRKKNGPNPSTKARTMEVSDLVRTGLKETLKALEGRVDVIGTSGYEVREDTISMDTTQRKG